VGLLKGLEHEWPRYLGYFVSFTFIGGVWIAHSNLTQFIKAADPDLMRLNLMLLLFVSFLPFTTAIAATHLFASNLTFHEVTVSTPTERVAVVVFGLNLTLAALMVYLMLRHAGRRGRRPSRGRTAGLRERTPVSNAAPGQRDRCRSLPDADRRGLLPGIVDILLPRSAPARAYPHAPPSRDKRRTCGILTRYASVTAFSSAFVLGWQSSRLPTDYVSMAKVSGRARGKAADLGFRGW
jgi:Endosomal/lysosomal potassium channel TMEM175